MEKKVKVKKSSFELKMNVITNQLQRTNKILNQFGEIYTQLNSQNWCLFIENDEDLFDYSYRLETVGCGYYKDNDMPKVGETIMLSLSDTTMYRLDNDVNTFINDEQFRLRTFIVEKIVKHYITEPDDISDKLITYRILVREANVTRKTLIEKA